MGRTLLRLLLFATSADSSPALEFAYALGPTEGHLAHGYFTHYPQTNGHAEASFKAIKHLIMKVAPPGSIDCEAYARGLLDVQNEPDYTGRSPAQILYGRPLRSCVPPHTTAYGTGWQPP